MPFVLEETYSTTVEAFENTARRYPTRNAYTILRKGDARQRITFGELARVTTECARILLAHAINQGDVVAMISQPRVAYAAWVHAILRHGAILLPLSHELSDSQLRAMLDARQAKFVIVEDRPLDVLANATRKCFDIAKTPQPRDISRRAEYGTIETRAPTPTRDSPAVIITTSGTSGTSKHPLLDHSNLTANIAGMLRSIHITHDDVIVSIGPWNHIMGFTVTLMLPAWTGSHVVFTDDFKAIGNILRDERATLLLGVPKLYAGIARKMEDVIKSRIDARILHMIWPSLLGRRIRHTQGWESLRFMVSGAGKLDPAVARFFWRLGLPLYDGYGLSETSPAVSFNDNPEKIGSVGRPIPNVFVKIVDTETGRELPPGHAGEVVVGGPCVMREYAGNPEATTRARWVRYVPWIHTRDRGKLDEDGYLYVFGRIDFVIVPDTGKNADPEDIESRMEGIPFVKQLLVYRGYEQVGQDQVEVVKTTVVPDWDSLARIFPDPRNVPLVNRFRDSSTTKTAVTAHLWESYRREQQGRGLEQHLWVRKAAHFSVRVEPLEETPDTHKIRRALYQEPKPELTTPPRA